MSKKIADKKPPVGRVVASKVSRSNHSEDDDFNWRTFDPAMLEGGVHAPLASELVTYRDRLEELLPHEGQYVLIKGREVAGFFRDRRSAVAAAIAKYGHGPVLIKKVVEREPFRRVGQALL